MHINRISATEGRKGQYRKAYRVFQSRRMKHIKAIQGEGLSTYVKASVLGSFQSSDVTHTVAELFEGNKPKKAFCECPVGACGLCCHAVLVFLQLKYFTNICFDLCPLHFLFHFTVNNVHQYIDQLFPLKPVALSSYGDTISLEFSNYFYNILRYNYSATSWRTPCLFF